MRKGDCQLTVLYDQFEGQRRLPVWFMYWKLSFVILASFKEQNDCVAMCISNRVKRHYPLTFRVTNLVFGRHPWWNHLVIRIINVFWKYWDTISDIFSPPWDRIEMKANVARRWLDLWILSQISTSWGKNSQQLYILILLSCFPYRLLNKRRRPHSMELCSSCP